VKLSTLERIFAALDAAGARYLVVGGVAVNAHGYQRLTHDLDLVIGLDPRNVERSMGALTGLGYRPMLPVSTADFADPVERGRWIRDRNLQVLSLVSDRSPDVTVDVFASEPFDFDAAYDGALHAEIAPGAKVRFLALPALIAMKRAAARPRDADDVTHLLQLLEESRDDD
jgi:hypothetical protein